MNPKGALIEHCRVKNLGAPNFTSTISGPEHQPVFTTNVTIAGQIWGNAQAHTKRDAEKATAEMALEGLQNGTPGDLTMKFVQSPLRLAAEAQPEGEEEDTNEDDTPWPIFPEVLAKTLEIANARTDTSKNGQQVINEIRDLALELYKDLLEDLGN